MPNQKWKPLVVIELHPRNIAFRLHDSKADTEGFKAEDEDLSHPDGNDKVKRRVRRELRRFYELSLKKYGDCSTIGSGIKNPDQSICYTNVVIQALSHSPFFSQYLLDYVHSKACKNAKNGTFCLMCSFEAFVKESRRSPNAMTNPFIPFIARIYPRFKPNAQDDCFSFLKHLLNSLSTLSSLKSNTAGSAKYSEYDQECEDDIVDHLFGGMLRTEIKCDGCNRRTETMEKLYDVSLETGDSTNIVGSLNRFFSEEPLEGYFCKYCKSVQPTRRRLSVYKLPLIMVLHLNQFFSFNLSRDHKDAHGKKQKKRLDLVPNLCITCTDNTVGEKELEYELYAIVCHLGHDLKSGHYVLLLKKENNFWYLFDDSTVKVVPYEFVLSYKRFYYLFFYCFNRTTTPLDDNRRYAERLNEGMEIKFSDSIVSPLDKTTNHPLTPTDRVTNTDQGEQTGIEQENPVSTLNVLSDTTSNIMKYRKYHNYTLMKLNSLSYLYSDYNPDTAPADDPVNCQVKEPVKEEKEIRVAKLKETTDVGGNVDKKRPDGTIRLLKEEEEEVDFWSDDDDKEHLELYKKNYELLKGEELKVDEEDLEYDRGRARKKRREKEDVKFKEHTKYNILLHSSFNEPGKSHPGRGGKGKNRGRPNFGRKRGRK